MHLLLVDSFLGSFGGIEIFEGSTTVACILMEVLLVLELNQKTYYLEYTNVANEDCVKFCMKEIFKCREEQCDKMKYGQNPKLGDATRVTPRNIQEVQASKLGDAQGIPFFINKNFRFLPNASFLLFHAQLCCSWSVFFFVLVFRLLCLLSLLNKLVGPPLSYIIFQISVVWIGKD